MKKYTAPIVRTVSFYEESEIMLHTGSKYADEGQYSNRRIEEDEADGSIWDN